MRVGPDGPGGGAAGEPVCPPGEAEDREGETDEKPANQRQRKVGSMITPDFQFSSHGWIRTVMDPGLMDKFWLLYR